MNETLHIGDILIFTDETEHKISQITSSRIFFEDGETIPRAHWEQIVRIKQNSDYHDKNTK